MAVAFCGVGGGVRGCWGQWVVRMARVSFRGGGGLMAGRGSGPVGGTHGGVSFRGWRAGGREGVQAQWVVRIARLLPGERAVVADGSCPRHQRIMSEMFKFTPAGRMIRYQ